MVDRMNTTQQTFLFRGSHRKWIACIVALCAMCPMAANAGGQGPAPVARLPADADIESARRRARESMLRIPAAGAPTVASIPKLESAPRPASNTVDIGKLADSYRTAGAGARKAEKPDVLIFASLSMPTGALKRIIADASQVGASLVFRGLKNNSMKAMGEEIQRLSGGVDVSVVIHPPAFRQYGIETVPAVVLANSSAGQVMEDGCSPAATFVKVTGDVSLGHALDYIERHSPAWEGVARDYSQKLRREE